MKMNKYFAILIKSFISLIMLLIFSAIGLYIFLNIYINSKAIEINSLLLKNESLVELSSEQIKIAAYIYTNDKNPKFTKLPLIADLLSSKNRVAYMVAETYFCLTDERAKKLGHMERRFIILGTRRKIEKTLDYKECYNYLYIKLYFGNGIYGINNASEFYFKKNYKELNCEEFVKLTLITLNPVIYDLIHGNQEKIERKVSEICSKL